MPLFWCLVIGSLRFLALYHIQVIFAYTYMFLDRPLSTLQSVFVTAIVIEGSDASQKEGCRHRLLHCDERIR